MLIITISHLVLFCFNLNLTDVCSDISFSEDLCRAGASQLICGLNHLTGSCMIQVFTGGGEGGCFRTDFSCLMFCHYLFYHWFKCFLFCLSMVIENVLWHARVGIFNAYKFQSIKIKHEESSAISEDIPVFH